MSRRAEDAGQGVHEGTRSLRSAALLTPCPQRPRSSLNPTAQGLPEASPHGQDLMLHEPSKLVRHSSVFLVTSPHPGATKSYLSDKRPPKVTKVLEALGQDRGQSLSQLSCGPEPNVPLSYEFKGATTNQQKISGQHKFVPIRVQVRSLSGLKSGAQDAVPSGGSSLASDLSILGHHSVHHNQ